MATLSFSLHVQIETTGFLRGGDLEQRGYLASSASFEDHRDRVITTLHAVPERAEVTLGPYTLPAADRLRGDESVHVMQWAYTRMSGVAELDAKEAAHKLRSTEAGTVSLGVHELLAAAAAKQNVRADLIHTPLLQTDVNDAAGAGQPIHTTAELEALAATTVKGVASLRVELHGRSAALLDTYRLEFQQRRDRTDGPLLFGTARQQQASLRVQALLFASHARFFFAGDGSDATRLLPPRYPVGPEKSTDRLHLLSYATPWGWLPAACYLNNTVETRPVAPGVDGRLLKSKYGKPSAAAYDFAERQLEAALLRAGLSHATFLQAIRAQHDQPRDDPSVSNVYKRALAALMETGTYAANSASYTADAGYHNVKNDTRPGAHAATRSNLLMADYARLGSFVKGGGSGYALTLSDGPDGEKKLFATRKDTESWLYGLLTGETNSEDCEGSGTTASAINDEHEVIGRQDPVPIQRPLLAAAREVFAKRIFGDVAASVTAALFNTAGEKMTKKDIKDLPVFGDAVDTASSVAGHLHGLWLALVQMALALQRAGHDLERDLPPLAKALREAAAWEFHVPVYVLEGTGGIEPMVLPTGEWSANDPQMMAQMKATRTLYETAAKVAPTLVANARFRGLGFYDAPQEPDRRLSTFYRGVSMLMSRKLMAMNPLYGVVAFINCKTQTRGLDIGAVLRDMGKPDGGPQAVGLVSAFASDPTIGRAVWDAEVEPLIACLMNQFPLSVYGRFLPAQTARPARTRAPTALESALPERATAAEALARIGHPLTLRTVLAMEQCPPAELGLALDRHSAGLALALKSKPLALRAAAPTIFAATKEALVDARTAVLTTQPWQLQQPGVAQKMIAELEALKKRGLITSYVLARNRPLSQCLDTVDIILRLPDA